MWKRAKKRAKPDTTRMPRLEVFFKHILTNERLTSVVASTIHNLKPRAGDSIKDLSPVELWYNELDARYNFSLGPAVIALSTTEQLEQLTKLDPPYLKPYNDIELESTNAKRWLRQSGISSCV